MTRCFGALLLLSACGSADRGGTHTGDSPSTKNDPCAPAVEIGTGEQFFVGLTPGDPLMMVHGPQGGWHMLAGVRITGTAPEVHIKYEIVHQPTGLVVSDNSYNLALLMDQDCSGTFVGMYGYLDVSGLVDGELNTPPELIAGDNMILRMDVQDFNFVKTSGELMVTAALDPVDQR